MIGAIENALIDELKKASDAGQLGYAWRTLDSYPDDFDAYLKEKGKIRTPAAWAVFLGLGQGADNGDEAGWQAEATFALIVAAQHVRNETATRHGGKDPEADPGSYQLTLDAVRILSRNNLCLELVTPIEVTGARLVARSAELRTQGLSLMAISLKCTVPFGRFEGEGNIAPFERFHADWDVPPLGNVERELPAGNPDAEDLVELLQ